MEGPDFLVLLELLEKEDPLEMCLRLLDLLDLKDLLDQVVFQVCLVWMERKVDKEMLVIRVPQVCQENQDLMVREVPRETQANLVLQVEMELVDAQDLQDLQDQQVLWLRVKRCQDLLDHLEWMVLRVSLVCQVLKERVELLGKEDNVEKMVCLEKEDQ